MEVREQAVLEAGDEDGRILEALGAVQRHQGDAQFGVQTVRVADQGDVVQEVHQGTDGRLGRFVEERRFAGVAALSIAGNSGDPRRNAAQAVKGLEVVGRRHEFVQVLEPFLGLLVALAVERLEAGGDDRAAHEFGQGLALRLSAQRLDEALEVPDRAQAAGRQLLQGIEADRVPQRVAHPGRALEQHLFGPAADAPPRLVQDPAQGEVVLRVGDDPQVGDQVLDLGTLVEPDPGDQAVGDLAAQQLVLDGPGLRVRPHQHGHVPELEPLRAEFRQPSHDPARLVLVVAGVEELQGVAGALVRPQGLAPTLFIAGDDGARSVEDVLGRAVVPLQLADAAAREVLLEPQQVVEFGPAPAVDALVLVADRGQARNGTVRVGHQVLHQLQLGRVRVLELVDEQVAKASPDPRADLLVVAQQAYGERDQVVEVDAARTPQLGLVAAEHEGDVTVEEVLGLFLEGRRREQAVLRPADPPLDRARLEDLFVEVLGLERRLDQPQLVRRVDDREVRPQTDPVAVAPQQADAEAVEGADEDTGVAADQVERPPAHLVRGLVGEGDGRDPPRLDVPLGDQPGDPVGDDPGLA